MNEIINYYKNTYDTLDMLKLTVDISEGENIQKSFLDSNFNLKVEQYIRKIDIEYAELIALPNTEVSFLSFLFGTSKSFQNTTYYERLNSYLNFLYSIRNSKAITKGLELLMK